MKPSRVLLAAFTLGLITWPAISAPPKAVVVAPPAPPQPAPEFAAWMNLCSLRPSSLIQAQLLARSVEPGASLWHAMKIEDGKGPLLLDQSALLITKLPSLEGKPLDPPALLNYVRRHFAELLQAAQMNFTPVAEADKALWSSEAPTGTIATLYSATGSLALAVTEATDEHFTFSSVQASNKDGAVPPLVWQRSFAVREALPFEGCLFTTHAVARAMSDQAAPTSPAWSALLTALADFVQKNGGAVETTILPSATTSVPWESVHEKFHQPKVAWLDLKGSWQSTDPSHRFHLEITGWTGTCEFIERNSRNQELKMTLPFKVEMEKPGELKFTIRRPNNTKEVLEYYGFPEGIRTEILTRQPEPSTLILAPIKGGKLNGLWSGISITKDASGKHLKEMKQPSEAKPKPYPFSTTTAAQEAPVPVIRKAKPVAE